MTRLKQNGKSYLLSNTFRYFRENDLRLMTRELTDDKWTFFHVMAWCRQVTNLCLSQCWPKSISPYDITRAQRHYSDVIMGSMTSQITNLTIVYSAIYSGADQRKHQKLCVTGLCVGNSPGQVNSPHKWPVTRKMFPFDDVIMYVQINLCYSWYCHLCDGIFYVHILSYRIICTLCFWHITIIMFILVWTPGK